MSTQWLDTWFPLTALLLQTIFWGQALPRLVSRRTMAIITFTQLPEDPNF